ncbi:MAG: hypothetical protein QM656_15530 [Paracoccaceae bacterium]
MTLARIAALVVGLSLLAACQKNDLNEPPEPMGNFALGLNIVVTEKMQKIAISREASQEEWKAAMTKAIDDRFRRYDATGTKLYNLGISVDAYALAPPGVPVVLKPRSALAITVTVWDDAAQTKLNPEAKQITVFEGMSGKTFIGSGLTQTKEEQMAILSYNAAKAVQDWMLEHPEWFGLPQKPVRTPPKPTSMSAHPAAAPQPAP